MKRKGGERKYVKKRINLIFIVWLDLDMKFMYFFLFVFFFPHFLPTLLFVFFQTKDNTKFIFAYYSFIIHFLS